MGGGASRVGGESGQVFTQQGPIIGRRVIDEGGRELLAFQGIPFAAPPIGELRFKKPQPPASWKEPLRTQKFARRGMQKDYFFFDKWRKGPCSEDNLYLNVFTPSWSPPPNGFPVVVFVHGGGFVMDGANTYGDIGICKHLVTKDVVVVSIQYRLGYFGFWTTGDSVCPGNLGLWDMTFALQWVQDNIVAFGGDKGNVTLAGQSAGGAAVDLLSLSPHSQIKRLFLYFFLFLSLSLSLSTSSSPSSATSSLVDLFHKVCPMAGNASSSWIIHPTMKENCDKMAATLGITASTSTQLIEKLRRIPAAKLATSVEIKKVDKKTKGKSDDLGGLHCTPVIDGDFLPLPISQLRKKAPLKPIFIGLCRSEALLFLATMNARMAEAEALVDAVVPEATPNREEVMKEIMDKYFDFGKESGKKETLKAFSAAFSDVLFATPTLKTIVDTLAVNPSTPIYNYVFDYINPASWGIFGYKMPLKEATHCTELAYLFEKGIIFGFKFNEDDRKMLQIFSTAFTNFAKYGDPNGASSTCTALPIRFERATPEEKEKHYIFDLIPTMSKVYFDGRPARLLELEEKHN